MEDTDILKSKELLVQLRKKVAPSNRELVTEVLELLEPFFTKAEKRLSRASAGAYLYKGFDPVTVTAKLASLLGEVPVLYAEAKRELTQQNKLTQDILHALELLDLSENEREQLTKDLVEVRRFRRVIKNFLELIEPLNDLVSKHNNFVTSLGKAQARVHTLRKDMESRRYSTRVRHDLADRFDSLAEGVCLTDDNDESDLEEELVAN